MPALEAYDVHKRDLQQVQQNVQDLENTIVRLSQLTNAGKIWALYNAIAIHRTHTKYVLRSRRGAFPPKSITTLNSKTNDPSSLSSK